MRRYSRPLCLLALLLAGGLAGGFAWQRSNAADPTEHAGHGAPTHSQPAMPGMPEMEGIPPQSRPSAVQGAVTIRVPREVQQRIGVTTALVRRGPLEMTVRTVGIVRPNETKVAHIHVRTEGWVQKLFVSFTGQKVKAGDPLLSIYSPQFLVAQREYLTALAAKGSVSGPMGTGPLVEASRQKLELLDIPAEEIEALVRKGTPDPVLMLRTHIDGTVLEKKAFTGQYVAPADELYVVADLSTVWVQAKVYEYELPHVQLGQKVTVTLPGLPMREFTGKVVFIDPVVEEPARTVQVRVELPNPDGLLKPGMFSSIMLSHAMGEGLLVPTEAVIRTGEQDIVFLAEADDAFVPVEVKISPMRFGDSFQVLQGLEAGQRVATSANFLIDSESRLQAGGGSMAGMPGMEMGGPEKTPAKAPEGSSMENMPGMQHQGDHSKMKH